MANMLNTNPMMLDTFAAAIDTKTTYPYGITVESIEWSEPAAAADTATITHGVGGPSIFDETCVTATQSIIKYFHGAQFNSLNIAIGAVSSGRIIIMLR